MKREETIDHQIKSCWHAIHRMYNQEAAKHNSTTSQAYVVLNIDPKEGIRVQKLDTYFKKYGRNGGDL